ncbi:MAG: EcsC family protein [Anaerovoracaceae bacterium]|jgi:hypothetical protein
MARRTEKEKRLLLREYIKLERQESRSLTGKPKKPGLMDKVRKKVPEKAMKSLQKAFEKGLFLIFDKGDEIIGKIGAMDKAMKEAEKYRRSLNLMVHKDTLKAIDNAAVSRIRTTKGTTVLEGAGLGIFGIGLPDIPIFLAMLLKTAYEIGASYGFDYRDEDEKPYTLAMLKVAFSDGEERIAYSKACDELGKKIDDDELIDNDVDESDLKEVAEVLSTDMLVGKFIQGMTFVGVVGGVINYKLVDKIAEVAKVKYKKRFLYRLINDKSDD